MHGWYASGNVDAYYEDGRFYITTWLESRKMKQIAQCEEVGFSVNMQGFYGNGIGKNLGWVLAEENIQLRAKLRKTFADWYEIANNEQSEKCVILEISIVNGTIMQDHGAVHYEIDFVNNVPKNKKFQRLASEMISYRGFEGYINSGGHDEVGDKR